MIGQMPSDKTIGGGDDACQHIWQRSPRRGLLLRPLTVELNGSRLLPANAVDARILAVMWVTRA